MVPPGDNLALVDALVDLRVGLNVIELRQLEGRQPMPRLRQALDALSRAYRAKREDTILDPRLLDAIDRMISAVLQSDPPANRAPPSVAALAGLRRTLFPTAPTFIPGQT